MANVKGHLGVSFLTAYCIVLAFNFMMQHILLLFTALSIKGVFGAPWQLPSRTAVPAALRPDHLQTSTTLILAPSFLRRTASPASIVALTTIFTLLAACLYDVYIYTSGTRTFASLGISNTSACFPLGWQPALTMHFSLGICPSGYTVACATTSQISGVSITTATCCARCVGV